jgi:hypothetical protein
MHATSAGLAVLIALTLVPSSIGAQTAGSAPGAPPRVVPTSVDEPPLIDGQLDDPAWKVAAHITDFVQQRPVEGAKATEATDIFVAYDKDTLYFGIHAHYSDIALRRANRVDRDQSSDDDTVTIFFDPFLDQQRGYAFSVNGYGVQGDSILQGASVTGGQSSAGDVTWNALFQSAGVLTDDGWTAELAIPIKSLRYPSRRSDEVHRWGFQILREIKTKDELETWSPVSTNVLGFLPQMGVLDGMRNLSTRRNFEVLPTVTAVNVGRLSPSGRLGSDHVEEAGVNVKYGLTPNVSLDFTYNPDFSQIESDQPQIEINQRFPLLFAELRPFFLEGKEIYQIPGPVGTLVHTRTIVDPQYGLKVSGKMGKTTFGVLVANDEAPGHVDDPTSPFSGQKAQVVVGRAKYDIYRESHLGFLFTDREFMNSYSRLAFIDGGFRLGSSARGGFQVVYSDRRDLHGVRRTAPVFNVDFRKEGRNLTYFGAHNDIHPDFGSDLAFIRRVGQHQTVGSVSYAWWPSRVLVRWGPSARYNFLYDYKGNKTDDNKHGSVNFQFVKNITLTASVDRDMERFRETNFDKTRYSVSGTVFTNRKILVRADANFGDQIRFVAQPFLGHTSRFNATVTLRPSSRFQSHVTLNATRFTGPGAGTQDFDVKIIRALTTYQFTPRLLLRNILEANTLNKTVGVNLLATYRVNSGTVFFVGYDDRYRQGDQIDEEVFATAAYQRTNRAVFAKLQYLYRY